MLVPDLSLRKEIQAKDALTIASWMEDEEIMRYLNEDRSAGVKIRQMVERTALPEYTHLFNDKGNFHIICHQDKPVGYVNLIPKGAGHEIVIAIGEKSLWGKGFGKVALRKALMKVFLEMRTKALSAKIKCANERSLRLFRSIGFQVEDVVNDTTVLSMDLTTFLKKAA